MGPRFVITNMEQGDNYSVANNDPAIVTFYVVNGSRILFPFVHSVLSFLIFTMFLKVRAHILLYLH